MIWCARLGPAFRRQTQQQQLASGRLLPPRPHRSRAGALIAPPAPRRDAKSRQRLRGAFAAFPLRSVAVSPSALGEVFFADPSVPSYHVAVGGAGGQLAVADELTLEPLLTTQVGTQAIGDLKYRRVWHSEASRGALTAFGPAACARVWCECGEGRGHGADASPDD